MYETLQVIHSYIAYVVLLILFIAVVNAFVGWTGKKLFTPEKDFRLSLFAMILCHIMLLLGLILYFVSPVGMSAIQELGMSGLNSASRLLALEHPFTNILAIAFITIGWSRHKKFIEGDKKFKSIAIFYGIGLLLILSRIPYGQWFN